MTPKLGYLVVALLVLTFTFVAVSAIADGSTASAAPMDSIGPTLAAGGAASASILPPPPPPPPPPPQPQYVCQYFWVTIELADGTESAPFLHRLCYWSLVG